MDAKKTEMRRQDRTSAFLLSIRILKFGWESILKVALASHDFSHGLDPGVLHVCKQIC